MKRILFSFAAFLLLLPAPLAFAESDTIDVSPDKPNAGGFHFDVTAKAGANNTVDFRVVVTLKGKHAAFVHPSTGLDVAKINANSEMISPIQQLGQQADAKSITCVFTVSEKSLDDPDCCFVFTNHVAEMVNGKEKLMPAETICILRLKNFYKKQAQAAAAAADGAH